METWGNLLKGLLVLGLLALVVGVAACSLGPGKAPEPATQPQARYFYAYIPGAADADTAAHRAISYAGAGQPDGYAASHRYPLAANAHPPVHASG